MESDGRRRRAADSYGERRAAMKSGDGERNEKILCLTRALILFHEACEGGGGGACDGGGGGGDGGADGGEKGGGGFDVRRLGSVSQIKLFPKSGFDMDFPISWSYSALSVIEEKTINLARKII